MADSYLALRLIHDNIHRNNWIDPLPLPPDRDAWPCFVIVQRKNAADLVYAAQLHFRDRSILDGCMARVEADLVGGAPPRPDERPDTPQTADQAPTGRKRKRSTERGEARNRIISALSNHHEYEKASAEYGVSCLNIEQIGVNELAQKAGVAKSTVSTFFREAFKGYDKYRALCRGPEAAGLRAAIKMLRGEYSPHVLFGRTPPGEGRDDDEEHDDD